MWWWWCDGRRIVADAVLDIVSGNATVSDAILTVRYFFMLHCCTVGMDCGMELGPRRWRVTEGRWFSIAIHEQNEGWYSGGGSRRQADK